MPGFTRQTLLAWLMRNHGEPIVIRARGTTLYLAGVCEHVEELDACSTEFTSCPIRLSSPDTEVSLTLHDTALALHVLLRDPHSRATALSIPVTLSFSDVILEREADLRESEAEKQRKAALSTPYRLLH